MKGTQDLAVLFLQLPVNPQSFQNKKIFLLRKEKNIFQRNKTELVTSKLTQQKFKG